MEMRGFCLFLLFLACFCINGFSEKIYLTNGDVLSGKVVKKGPDVWILKHEALGEISIPVGKIKRQNRQAPANSPKATKSLSLGYDQKAGNSQAKAFSSEVKLHYKALLEETEARLSVFYSSSDGKMDDRRAYLLARQGYSLGAQRKWYWFLKAEALHDRFSDIRTRYLPSIGVGYWFSDEAPIKAMLEGSLGWQWTDFYFAPDDGQATSVIRAFLEFKLWEGCSFLQDISVYPSLEGISDYRISSLSELSVPVVSGMSLSFSLKEDFDNSPSPGKKKSDTRFISSLKWNF